MRAPLLLLCLLLALAAAACGGKEASVVDRAFEDPVRSAQVTLRLTVDGAEGQDRALELAGPWRSNGPGRLHSFDWRARLVGGPAGSVAGRLVSTGENLFVGYGGETYEVGEARVAELERRAAAEERRRGDVDDAEDLERLGVDPKGWFPESEEQDAEAAGVPTTKVTGRLDVDRAVRDVARLLRRPELRGQLGGRAPSATELRLLAAMLEDPRFELHAGREDGKLRRLAATARVRPPHGEGAPVTVRVALELRAVDQPVRFDAPSGGRPIEELLRQLQTPDASSRRTS